MAASFWLCCDREPGIAILPAIPSTQGQVAKHRRHSDHTYTQRIPALAFPDVRELFLTYVDIRVAGSLFSRFFDIYLSHLLAVTQLLAKVIQPIQTAEIQRQRATFARFPHPDGGSRAQMFRKFRGQILSGQRGS